MHMSTAAIDVLDYMLPNQVWALDHHLAEANNGQPILTLVQGNVIWYVKDAKGYPWDVNLFDDSYVYQLITENVWTDPTTYKIFTSKTWPNGQGGIVWAPRK